MNSNNDSHLWQSSGVNTSTRWSVHSYEIMEVTIVGGKDCQHPTTAWTVLAAALNHLLKCPLPLPLEQFVGVSEVIKQGNDVTYSLRFLRKK